MGDARTHRLGESDEPRQRAHHDGELRDQPVGVEAQVIEPEHCAARDTGGEDERVRALAGELVDVDEVGQDLQHLSEHRGDGLATGEGLEGDG